MIVLFSRVDINEVKDSFARAQLGAFALTVLVATSILFVVDALSVKIIFKRLLGPITTRDVLAFKGVSHFGQALNITAAAATMAALLGKRYGFGFRSSFSAFLFQMAVDVMTLIIMMTVGLVVGGDQLPPQIRDTIPFILAVGWPLSIAGVAFWVIGDKIGLDRGWLGKLRNWRFFDSFRRAKLADYFVVIAARSVLLFGYMCTDYLLVRTFGIETPFGAQLAFTALISFTVAVPLSISGLGAIQVVLIALYTPFVIVSGDPTAQVLAFSTLMGPTVNLCRIGIAYLFLGQVSRDLIDAAQEEVKAETG